MKIYLLTALVIALLLPQGQSLFGNTTANSFGLSGFTNPAQQIAIEGTGSKFMVWNNKSQIQMYTTNGTKLCSAPFANVYKVLWPAKYNPIILLKDCTAFVTLNESNCQAIQTFNIQKITNITGELGFWMNFAMKSNRPTLAVSGFIGVYEIDLATASLVNIYTTLDQSLPYLFDTFYSADQKLIFVSMADRKTLQFTLRIWNTSSVMGKPLKEITYTDEIQGFFASRDNNSVICTSMDEKASTTTVSTIDTTGKITKKITRPTLIYTIAVGDTDVFDSVLFFYQTERRMEVLKLETAESLQNITKDDKFIDVGYAGRNLVLLDTAQQINSYSYKDDFIPVPPPKPDDDGIPLWVIIAAAAGGAVIIAVVVFVVCKKMKANKNQRFDNKNYGKLNDEV